MKKLVLLTLSLGLMMSSFAQQISFKKSLRNEQLNANSVVLRNLDNYKLSTKKQPSATISNVSTSIYDDQENGTKYYVVDATITPNSDCNAYYVAAYEPGLLEDVQTMLGGPDSASLVDAFKVLCQYQIIGYLYKEETYTFSPLTYIDPTLNQVQIGVLCADTINGEISLVTDNFDINLLGGSGTANVNASVSNIQAESFDLSVTPNDQTAYYLVGVYPQAGVDAFGEHANDSVRLDLESKGAGSSFYGNLSLTVGSSENPLEEDGTYYVYVLPYNNAHALGTTNANPLSVTASSLNDVATASVSVYPNPTSNNITVSSLQKINNVEIINTLGQVVYSDNTAANGYSINVKNFERGTYFVKVRTNGKVSTSKVIVK